MAGSGYSNNGDIKVTVDSSTSLKHLVIGVNGTIGSALYSRLRSIGESVKGTTQRQQSVLGRDIVYLNLLDPSSWRVEQPVDVAYICAGVCRMALCEEDPVGTANINIDATLALARKLAANGTFLVYLSTNQVFSGESPYAKAEAEYGAQNEYGRQKARIEALLKANCPSLAIVRLTKVVEPQFPLIQNWIQQLTSQQPVRAFKDMMLAPVSLRQVVDIIIKIGEKKQSGIYHVSGAEDVSYYDLACYLADQLSCSRTLVQSADAREGGMQKSFLPKFTTLDCSSIIAAIGEKPPHYVEVIQECFGIS
jgi:dTDP-4-dehydrorhamnose reductase